MEILVPLYALFAPILVWPVELLFPYPFVVEELIKAVIVFFSERDSTASTASKIKLYVLAGVFFALSETVLYILNFNAIGRIDYLLVRFVLTSVLHTTTFLVMYAASKSLKGLPLGFILAVLIHYIFNLVLTKYSFL